MCKHNSEVFVCISIDDNYLIPALVMLDSLLINNLRLNIHLFVLYSHNQLTGQSKDKIEKLILLFQKNVTFIRVDEKQFLGFPLVEYISVTTYFRLLLPKILPTNVNKVLYLDVDLIIDGEIEELYNLEMDGYAFAGVVDRYMNRIFPLKIPIQNFYINAGVLLINIEWLRSNVSLDDIFLYIKKNKDILHLADQDVINGLFYKNLRHIPRKYNYNPRHDLFYYKRTGIDKPIIYHYYGKVKPWDKLYTGFGKEIYWKYVNRTIVEYKYRTKLFHMLRAIYRNFLLYWKCFTNY